MQFAVNMVLMILMVVSALFAVLLIAQGHRVHRREQQAKLAGFSDHDNTTGPGHKN